MLGGTSTVSDSHAPAAAAAGAGLTPSTRWSESVLLNEHTHTVYLAKGCGANSQQPVSALWVWGFGSPYTLHWGPRGSSVLLCCIAGPSVACCVLSCCMYISLLGDGMAYVVLTMNEHPALLRGLARLVWFVLWVGICGAAWGHGACRQEFDVHLNHNPLDAWWRVQAIGLTRCAASGALRKSALLCAACLRILSMTLTLAELCASVCLAGCLSGLQATSYATVLGLCCRNAVIRLLGPAVACCSALARQLLFAQSYCRHVVQYSMPAMGYKG
jgi:hypothetical protein